LLLRDNWVLEAQNPTTNLVGGSTEVGALAMDNVNDNDLIYLVNTNGQSEYLRVRYRTDAGGWDQAYDGAQEQILSLAVYDGKLYAGQGMSTGDGDVYRYTSTGTTTAYTPLQYAYDTNALMYSVHEWIPTAILTTNLTYSLRIVTDTNQNFDVISNIIGVE